MPQSSLELYTSIVPSPRQTAFQEGGFHVFFHYGICLLYTSDAADE